MKLQIERCVYEWKRAAAATNWTECYWGEEKKLAYIIRSLMERPSNFMGKNFNCACAEALYAQSQTVIHWKFVLYRRVYILSSLL